MPTGQCKTDPVDGIAGDIYNALTADSDNGLAPSATEDGSTARKLLGALLESIAASIDGNSGGGFRAQQTDAATAFDTNSAAYVPATGYTSLTFAAPRIDYGYTLFMKASGYMAVAADDLFYAIAIDGSISVENNVFAQKIRFSALNDHREFSFDMPFTMTDTDPHTVSIYVRTTGTGTFHTDTHNRSSILIAG